VHLKVDGRQYQKREQRRGGQATGHHYRQPPFDLRAVQLQHEQREQAQRRRRGGQQLGADAADARLADGIMQRSPVGQQPARLCYQHEAVLNRDAKQADQADERRDRPRA
jgi:hypothetical protein